MSFDGQHNHSKTRGSSRDPSDVILQIGRPGNATRQFPAVIRNLTAGVASLEVDQPAGLNGMGGLSRGRAAACASWPKGTGNLPTSRGRWFGSATSPGAGTKGMLSLDLVLDQPTAAAQKLLNEHIPNRPRDIQELWERWDQARQPSAQRVALPTRLGFVGVTLLFCGLIMHTGGAGPHQLFAWMFWLIGYPGGIGPDPASLERYEGIQLSEGHPQGGDIV